MKFLNRNGLPVALEIAQCTNVVSGERHYTLLYKLERDKYLVQFDETVDIDDCKVLRDWCFRKDLNLSPWDVLKMIDYIIIGDGCPWQKAEEEED